MHKKKTASECWRPAHALCGKLREPEETSSHRALLHAERQLEHDEGTRTPTEMVASPAHEAVREDHVRRQTDQTLCVNSRIVAQLGAGTSLAESPDMRQAAKLLRRLRHNTRRYAEGVCLCV
jgi:hypothetical protein